MDITISVDTTSPRAAALGRAMDAYNARNTPLNEQQFLQKLVEGQLDGLVQSYLTTTLSKIDFLGRFTVDERVTIRSAAASDGVVKDYLELLNAATEVSLISARTIAGVQALEAGGLIASGRGAVILAL